MTTTDNPNDESTPPSDDSAPVDVGTNDVVTEEFEELSARLDRLWPETATPSLAAVSESTLPFASRQIAHYDLIRVLGNGAFGIVYLANDTHLDRQVALKLPRPEVLLDEEKRLRFASEATLAARLDHPGIVPVYDADLTSATPYIATAFCDGPTLAEWMEGQTEPTSWLESIEMLAKVADAVHYAHEQGISHRDLKPANLLLVPGEQPSLKETLSEKELEKESLANYEPRVTDFGLAKLADASLTDTRSSLLIGTPHYMAPEQLERGPTSGPVAATDVYSLGVILFELLTGQLPIEGESYIEVLDSIRQSRAKRLREFRAELPRDLERICAKCLEKNPAARYTTMADFATDLRRCAEGLPIAGRSLGVFDRVHYWCTRPQRVRDAGWFAVWCQAIWFVWTTVTFALAPLYNPVADAAEWDTLFPQVIFIIVGVHVLLGWVGWQTVLGKPWAKWVGLGLCLFHIPGFIISIVRGPLVFPELYKGKDSYFAFIIYFMLLLCFSIQLFLFCCAIAAERRHLKPAADVDAQ